MEIVLVRHAEPHWEPDERAVDDPELTARGRKMAECVARALEDEAFDAFYASPTRRTRETAAPVADRLGLEPRTLSWLHEIRLPSLEGSTTARVREYFQAAQARSLEQWWDGPPDGGESFRHFHERVTGGIEALLLGEHRLRIHEDAGHRLWQIPEGSERLLIVAHEGTNAVLLSHLLGIEPTAWEWVRFSSHWAGISRLHTTPIAGAAVWRLECFNRVEHLREVWESETR